MAPTAIDNRPIPSLAEMASPLIPPSDPIYGRSPVPQTMADTANMFKAVELEHQYRPRIEDIDLTQEQYDMGGAFSHKYSLEKLGGADLTGQERRWIAHSLKFRDKLPEHSELLGIRQRTIQEGRLRRNRSAQAAMAAPVAHGAEVLTGISRTGWNLGADAISFLSQAMGGGDPNLREFIPDAVQRAPEYWAGEKEQLQEAAAGQVPGMPEAPPLAAAGGMITDMLLDVRNVPALAGAGGGAKLASKGLNKLFGSTLADAVLKKGLMGKMARAVGRGARGLGEGGGWGAGRIGGSVMTGDKEKVIDDIKNLPHDVALFMYGHLGLGPLVDLVRKGGPGSGLGKALRQQAPSPQVELDAAWERVQAEIGRSKPVVGVSRPPHVKPEPFFGPPQVKPEPFVGPPQPPPVKPLSVPKPVIDVPKPQIPKPGGFGIGIKVPKPDLKAKITVKPKPTPEPVKPAAEPKQPGARQSIMDVESTVVDTQRIGGVDYELYKGVDPDKRAVIRVFDADSGQVVDIARFPSFGQAEAQYRKTVEAAMKTSSPAPEVAPPAPKAKPQKVKKSRKVKAKPEPAPLTSEEQAKAYTQEMADKAMEAQKGDAGRAVRKRETDLGYDSKTRIRKRKAAIKQAKVDDEIYQELLKRQKAQSRKAAEGLTENVRAKAEAEIEAGTINRENLQYVAVEKLPDAVRRPVQETAEYLKGRTEALPPSDKRKATISALQKIVDGGGKDRGSGVEEEKKRIIKYLTGEAGHGFSATEQPPPADPIVELFVDVFRGERIEGAIRSIDLRKPNLTADRVIDRLSVEHRLASKEGLDLKTKPEEFYGKARQLLEEILGRKIEPPVAGKPKPKDLMGREIVEPIQGEQKGLAFPVSTAGEQPAGQAGSKAWLTKKGKLRYEDDVEEIAKAAKEKTEGQKFLGAEKPDADLSEVPFNKAPSRTEGVSRGSASYASQHPSRAEGVSREPITIKPIESPEMLKLATAVTGKYPVVTRRLRKALGAYKASTGEPGQILLRPDLVKMEGDQLASTFAHEIGHAVDHYPDYTMARGNVIGRLQSLKKFMKNVIDIDATPNKEYRTELLALSKWWKPYDPAKLSKKMLAYRQSSVELYADAFSVLLNAPKELQNRAPKFLRTFLATMDKKPAFRDAWGDVQKLLRGTPEELAASRRATSDAGYEAGEQIIKSVEKARQEAEPSILSWLKTKLVNRGQAIVDLEKNIVAGGKSIPTEQSPSKLLGEYFYKENDGVLFAYDVEKQVYEPLIKAGVVQKDMHEFLKHQRILGGDRAKLINPGNFTMKTSADQLAALERKLGPVRYAKLETHMQKFHDLVYKIMEDAAELGVISQELFEGKIKPNKDHYATFAVIEYLEGQLARSGTLPATIQSQLGTMKEVANTFAMTIMKAGANQRRNSLQRLRKPIIDLMLKADPENIVRQPSGPKVRNPAVRPGWDNIWRWEDGKLQAYQVPQDLADTLNNLTPGQAGRVGRVVDKVVYGLFHPLYVEFNPSWQAFNMPRDFSRTYHNLALYHRRPRDYVLDMVSLLKGYKKRAGSAWAYSGGDMDTFARQMMEEKALGPLFINRGKDMTTTAYERMLKFTVPPVERNKMVKTAADLLGAISRFGRFQEAWGKMGAYEAVGKKGIKGAARAEFVRDFSATPNIAQKGEWTPLFNRGYMYSNVWMQGLTADMKLATNPKTAAAWWIRTAAVDLVPKAIMKAGKLGLLGAGVKEGYDLVSDYYLSNYIVIPIAITKDEKTGTKKVVAIKLPHAESGRLFASIFWKAMHGKGGMRTVQDILGVPVGEMPGLAPPLKILGSWGSYLTGRNPSDRFRGRDIIGPDAWKARQLESWPATQDMLRWTAQQFGIATQLLSPLFREPGMTRKQGPVEKAVKATPGLNRILIITNRGAREKQWEQVELEDADRALFRLGLPEAVKELVRERYYLNRIGAERLNETDRARRAELNAFYSFYLRTTKRLRMAKDDGDKEAIREIMFDLEVAAKGHLETE